ncbi:hypothetical protein N658DRAFT_491172 [Parathielavia hyrcaniae]|uniref:Uncharacterized protein n=1 Tax=Parathielavia hyrcaniae TaxID=113614 RepID=A0AAN6QAB8_9PEZI|nr:hypothetical protein N658DRAFT_491172 [Parathielavia hyrcaniae]
MPAGKPTLVAPTSDAELRALRRRCARALWALAPKGLGRLYFAGGLLRARPILRARLDKTEGSAELKTAGKSERHSDRAQDPPSEEKASEAETVVPPLSPERGQERSRSGSRSRRSAPVPRPKTGGQGLAAANVSADPPITHPPPLSATASACEKVGGGMASTRLAQHDEKGWLPDRDRVGAPDDRDDDDEEIIEEIERGILDVFSDSYSNKHLVYGMLELILVRLLPELTEKGVLELWAERIPVDC